MTDNFQEAYAESVAKETEIRDNSFLPEVPWRIGELSLRWMTPLDYKILDDAGNLVMDSTVPLHDVPLAHVAAFLWFMMIGNDPKERGFWATVRKRILLRHIARFGSAKYALLARQYLNENMQDSPASEGGSGRAMTTSWLVILCDAIASEYGWDDEVIVRKPIARLFQYLNRIHERSDPNAPRFNPSDSVKNMLLR